MLKYVPVVFELYRPLKPHLRWTLQCLVSFADRTGRCWPSVRTLAAVAGISKSSVSRHLAELSRDGRISRTRRPGGVYEYRIDSAFLPAAREVSHQREGGVPPTPSKVSPPAHTEEKTSKKTPAGLPDDLKIWEPRLRSWRKSRFWIPYWGPTPSERGCFAPATLLSQMGDRQ